MLIGNPKNVAQILSIEKQSRKITLSRSLVAVARVGAAVRQEWLIPESIRHFIGGLPRPTSGL
jgi:hypothetical protein